MSTRQRVLFLAMLLALGGAVFGFAAAFGGGGARAWVAAWVSVAIGFFAAVVSSADTDQRFFGNNQRGLRLLRTTGALAPARVLGVSTDAQDELGNVFIKLRLDVAPETSSRFITYTTAKIAVTDVPRFQPGSLLPVRHLPEYSGAVTLEPHPTEAQLQTLDGTRWVDAEGLAEFSGKLPELRPGTMRAVASILLCLVAVGLGASMAAWAIGGAS